MDPRRRLFLRGRVAQATQAQAPARPRPPWALAEAEFLHCCTRCNACVAACPEHILAVGDGGFPEVDFRQRACTLCGQCASVCEPRALLRQPERPAWRWKPLISKDCLSHRQVECRVCGEACDESALRFPPRLGGVALPVLDPQRCTGCGACVAPCPTAAVSMQVPAVPGEGDA